MNTQAAFDFTKYLTKKNPQNLGSEDIAKLRSQLSRLEESCIGAGRIGRELLKGELAEVDYHELNPEFLGTWQEKEFSGKKAHVPKFGVYEIDTSTMDSYVAQIYIDYKPWLPLFLGGGWECNLNDTEPLPGSFFIPILRSIFGPFDEKRTALEPALYYFSVEGIVPEIKSKTNYCKVLSGGSIKSHFYGSIPTEIQEKIIEAEKTNYFEEFFIIAETKPEDWFGDVELENKIKSAPKNPIVVGTRNGNAFYIDKFDPVQ